MSTPRDALSRRALLGMMAASGLMPLLPRNRLLPAFAPAGRAPGDRRLLLLYLEGGNDGLNTVVPHEDPLYHDARPRLALSGTDLPRLDDLTALHPALAPWERLHDEGQLAVLRDVGMHEPDRSHFVARDIVHAGRLPEAERTQGWVGRALDASGTASGALPGLALGALESPLILKGPRRTGLTLDTLETLAVPGGPSGAMPDLAALAAGRDAAPLSTRVGHVAQDAYALSDQIERMVERVPAGDGYPDSALGDRLRLAARLVRADDGPTTLWTSLGGFDTHAVQSGTHTALLMQLAAATSAFVDDLARDGTHRRTLVLVYSEFGRRVKENGSGGTDHGAAGPMFALGGSVKGGLHGPPSDLERLQDGDVRARVDFRSVFSEVATRWMGWDAEALFGPVEDGPGFVG